MTAIAIRLLLLASLAIGALGSTGCGLAYSCRWSNAGEKPTPATGIEGRWQGTWKSDANGHDGGLRCIVTRKDDGAYRADFRATYGWLFSFGYAMDLTVKAADSTTQPSVIYFQGQEDLGWLAGGLYHYDGKANGTEFFCTYKSEKDWGVFQMVRPGGKVVSE